MRSGDHEGKILADETAEVTMYVSDEMRLRIVGDPFLLKNFDVRSLDQLEDGFAR